MRRTTPIRRAVVVLDHSSGHIRVGDEEALGLDLWPETTAAIAQAAERGLSVTVAVPSELPGVEDLDGWADGFQVARIGAQISFAEVGSELTDEPGDPATAVVTADRRLRGDVVRAGLQPAPHANLLPMLARGLVPEAVR
ncbi:MAG: hypothetical protein OEZ14_02845, partial [Acidimicrobiia bacterium]|nr:hypothetical protein [Acidimicrobiia bacterium]